MAQVGNFGTQKQPKAGGTCFQVFTTQKLLLVVAFDGSQPLWLGCWLLAKAKVAKSPTKGALNHGNNRFIYNQHRFNDLIKIN
jgi:hypothetical protein